MLHIDRTDVGAATILRLTGTIDEGGVEALRDAWLACYQEDRFAVVANVSGVKGASRTGLGALLECLRMNQTQQGDFALVGMNTFMERELRMASALHYFNRYESEAQALQRFLEAA